MRRDRFVIIAPSMMFPVSPWDRRFFPVSSMGRFRSHHLIMSPGRHVVIGSWIIFPCVVVCSYGIASLRLHPSLLAASLDADFDES